MTIWNFTFLDIPHISVKDVQGNWVKMTLKCELSISNHLCVRFYIIKWAVLEITLNLFFIFDCIQIENELEINLKSEAHSYKSCMYFSWYI